MSTACGRPQEGEGVRAHADACGQGESKTWIFCENRKWMAP